MRKRHSAIPNQTERILAVLQNGKTLTAHDMHQMGIMQCNTRILELRRARRRIYTVHTEQNERRQGFFAHYVELLGEKAATRLKDGIFQYNRQESSYIVPRCNKALRYLRDEKMRADFDRLTESKSSVEAVNILTRDYGLCCRQVWYILKGY